jgi:hypothetical protein
MLSRHSPQLSLSTDLALCQPSLCLAAAIASWLPGRSAEGVKQALATHVNGRQAAILTSLVQLGLPASSPALLEAWTPAMTQAAVQVRLREGLCQVDVV